MKILVLNCGSSSLKYCLFDMGRTEDELSRGSIEHIGSNSPRLIIQLPDASKIIDHIHATDHRQAIQIALQSLTNSNYGVISSFKEIEAVGHRVVNGGKHFAKSKLLNEGIMRALNDLKDLAPLHNPFNIIGIEVITSILPNIPQVGVFDTAFHQTLPANAYTYALPFELYEKQGIRRYGFHGTSHRYVTREAARFMERPIEELRLISCHLGNGSSVTAIKFGKSIDTSMGFTPLEGLAMGTRCGDLDPAIIFFVMNRVGLNPNQVEELLNKKSGLLGVSGYTSNMQEIEEATYADTIHRSLNSSHPHHKRSKLALDIFIYRLKKYVGAYAAAMGGLDAIIFTGGIGERSNVIQEDACKELEFLGIEIGQRIDLGEEWYELSTHSSKVRVLIIPTNEELMIARDTYQIINKDDGS